ncbi:MAG: T9SS type A sorting domain-containing protein [Flavobacteriales bacterium]|nr:T9SS type A sorting domain-containing protein [Flavobacteriales bacterium]MCC6938041.1 T9SS type A sorting domain-containing protein [Flavobacteriales bacterium]
MRTQHITQLNRSAIGRAFTMVTVIALCAVGALRATNANAQYCGTATTNTVITPTTVSQNTVSYNSGIRAFSFATTAGRTYYFATCGLSTGDTYLRLYSTGTGGTVLASNDDGCSAQSTFSYVETASTTRSVLLTRYSCNALTAAAQVSYYYVGPPTCTYTVPGSGNNSITTCSGTICDPGGTGNYAVNQNGYTVINPSTGGMVIRIVGQSSAGEACCDYVRVYDGAGTGGTILGTYYMGTAIPTLTSTTGPLTVQFYSDISVTGAGFQVGISCVAPPPVSNDLVCNAQVITCGSTTPGTTVGFTSTGTYEGTSTCGVSQSQPGAWYAIVGNGQTMTASLCATAWDSRISIYSGTCTSLTCIGGNDDSGPACTGLSASYSWVSTNGVTYYIKVYGYSSSSAFSLSVACTVPPTPPANNNCANAVGLTVGANGSCPGAATAGTTVGATGGAAPAPGCLITGLVDVWYSFFSGSNTSIQFSIVEGTQTAFGYQILTACGGTEVYCEGDVLSGSFAVTANTNYIFRALTLATTTGTFTICLQAPPTPPANDLCASSIPIPGAGPFPHLTTVVNNTNATNTGQPTPTCQGTANGSIWYSFTPTCSGEYRFSTCPADAPSSGAIDHVLVVGTGVCGGAFTELACSDDAGALCSNATSSVIPSVSLNAGTTYRIVAYTYSTVRGNIQIQTSMLAPMITSFSASSACAGSSLVINGTNLACATSVTIGGTAATITANTATSVTVTVGTGTTGPVVVTCQAGTISSAGGVGSVTVGQPAVATFTVVNDCANERFSVQVNVTSLGSGSSADLTYTENGVPLFASLGLGTTTVGPFAAGSEVICTLSNGSPGCTSTPEYRYSTCPVTVTCGSTLSVNHCYRNFDTRTFTFTSSDPMGTLTLSFISGTMGPGDVIRTYSGTNNGGAPIPTLTGHFATLTGVSGTSVGTTLFIEIDSDGSNSCATGQQTSWNFEVKCTAGCTEPDAAISVNNLCATNQFNIDAEILFTGDGSSVTLQYTVNGGAPTDIPGLLENDIETLGPFAIGDVVNVRLLHESDAACDRNFGNFFYSGGCPSAETCVNALNLATQSSPLPGTTLGRVHDFTFACGTATANTAPDAIYYMDVPNGAQFNIRQQSNTYNSQHYVRYGGACPGTNVIACVDDDAAEIGWVNWSNTTGTTQRVWWIQDGFGTGSGNFVLEWQLITCPIQPGNPTIGTGTYTICQNTTVPGGQGLSASCAPIAQSTSNAFPGSNFQSEGTTITTRSTLVMPALPAGAVVTAARLKLFNVVANTGILGLDGQRQNIRVALNGSYILAETQLTTATGPGTVSPNPVINLVGFPAAGGTINLRTRQTADNLFTTPDAVIASALIEVDYTVPATVRWYSAPVSGTLHFTGPLFDPVGQSVVSNAAPSITPFYAACAYNSCESIRAATSFTVKAPPTTATVGGAQTICALGATIGLGGNTPTVGTGAWSIVSGGTGTFSSMSNPNATFTHTGGAGPVVLRWTITNAPCAASFAEVSITINQNPSAATVGGTQTVCILGTTNGLGGNAPTIGIGAWSAQSGGTGNFSPDANDPNATFTHATGAGPVVLRWTISNAPCASTNAEVSITIQQPSIWYADADGDGFGSGPSTGTGCTPPNAGDVTNNTDNCPMDPNTTQTDTDSDGAGDACDICPTVPNGTPGDACDDGDAFTFNDMLGASPNCGCAGTACTQSVTIEMGTDGSGLRWTLRSSVNNTVVQSSPGYPAYDYPPPSPNYTVTTCLPNGEFYFVFEDENCDGIAGGGYIVRVAGKRVIDNRTNHSGCPSQIAGNTGVNVPTGNDRLISVSCDRLDLRRNVNGCSDKLTADDTPNGTSGNVYQFWIYEPNGGLSIRYPANGPGSNQVSMANLPSLVEGTMYNVRVRTRIGPGVWRAWGNSCRMMIDNIAGQCKKTSLFDDTSSPNWSCGRPITLPVGNQGNNQGNKLVAWPVTRYNNNCVNVSATKYQWRFRIPAENVVLVRNSTNYSTFMENAAIIPTTLPNPGGTFQPCKTYEVEVRASFDGGQNWCVGGADPYGDLTPWGKVCEVYTQACFQPGGNQHMASDPSTGSEGAAIRMYPNPNRGDQLFLSLDAIEEGVNTVSVDIYDTFGKRVSARTLQVQSLGFGSEGFINTVLELNGELATGLYMVNITVGDTSWTERLVIQP